MVALVKNKTAQHDVKAAISCPGWDRVVTNVIKALSTLLPNVRLVYNVILGEFM